MAATVWKPRRIRSTEERSAGNSDFLSLKKEENFLGFPLFEGDPAIDEPGYYEYYEHWDQDAKRRIPCPGEEVCPLCEDGNQASTRAKTLWLVQRTKIKGDSREFDPPKVMIFNLNWNLIKMVTEMRTEGDKIKGRLFRVSCLDDRGNYSLTSKEEKLTATAIKEALKDAPDLDKIVTNSLRKAMEGLSLRAAMDADDEPEEEETTSRRETSSGKGKDAKPKDEEPEGWPDEAEDLEVTVDSVDDDNFMLVSHDEYGSEEKVWGTKELDLTEIEPGATITVTYFTDDEDDKVATAFEVQETSESGGSSDLPDKITEMEFEVVGNIDRDDWKMDVRNDDYEFTLYVLENANPDWDDYEEGTKIIVTCAKDREGDMTTKEAPVVVTSGAKKGGKGGSKGRKTSKGS